MPLTVAAAEKLVESLPKHIHLRQPQGGGEDQIDVTIWWAPSVEEGIPDSDKPAVVLQDITDNPAPDDPVTGLMNKDPNATTATSDTFTFDATQDDYRVTEEDMEEASVEVTGTLNGSSGHTFTKDTDYEVVDPDNDGAFEVIRWLDGGDNPDDGTDFTVDYNHFTPARDYGERSHVKVQMHAHTTDLEAGDRGASEAQHREDIMRALVNRLKTWWRASAPQDLADVQCAARERGAISDFSYLEGRGTLRKGFDLTIGQAQAVRTTTRTVREVTGDVVIKMADGDEVTQAFSADFE